MSTRRINTNTAVDELCNTLRDIAPGLSSRGGADEKEKVVQKFLEQHPEKVISGLAGMLEEEIEGWDDATDLYGLQAVADGTIFDPLLSRRALPDLDALREMAGKLGVRIRPLLAFLLEDERNFERCRKASELMDELTRREMAAVPKHVQ